MGLILSTSALLAATGSSGLERAGGSGRGASLGTTGVLIGSVSFAAGVDTVSPNVDSFGSIVDSIFFEVAGVIIAVDSVGGLLVASDTFDRADFESIDLGWLAVDSVRECCLLGTIPSPGRLPRDALLAPC